MNKYLSSRFGSPLALGAIALAVATGAAACSDDEDSNSASPAAGGMGGSAGAMPDAGPDGLAGSSGNPAPDAAGTGRIRVVHASADAPAVDIYAKGNATPVIANLAYGKASAWLELPQNWYDLELRAAGASPTDPPAFEISKLEVMAGKSYTAVAAGSLASKESADSFRVLALEEGFGAGESGKARVRIVHASYDAPAVDLDVGNDDPSKPELSGLARFADTGAEGVALPSAAALQIGIAAGGKTVTAFTSPALPDKADLFVIATGQLAKAPRDETGFALLAVLADGTTMWLKQNPFVYALHASPDAPAVDIYAGSAELFDNVPYGAMGRVQVPPGSYTLDFYAGQSGATPRPSSAPAASSATPDLTAGETYLAIASGLLSSTGANKFQLIPIVEKFAPVPDGKALVRVVHASPDAPGVDISTVSTKGSIDTPALISGLSFPNATPAEGAPIPASSLTLGVAAKGTTSTVAEFTIAPSSGQRVIAVASGLLSPSSGQPGFGLLLVDATSTNITAPWAVAPLAPNQ